MGIGCRQHHDLDEFRHALPGGAASGKDLEGEQHQHHQQPELGHGAGKGAEKDPQGGSGKQVKQRASQKQGDGAFNGNVEQALNDYCRDITTGSFPAASEVFK